MPEDLQLKIKELLASMTQTELAERIGCGQSIISLLANGQRGSRISYDLATRIERVYMEQQK
jgi:transcriptional regulator with XRE-family HTH domain